MSYVRPRMLPFLSLLLACGAVLPVAAEAGGFKGITPQKLPELAPHKALYDIDLVATHSGSQILNISGKMSYEWKPDCEGWVTGHKFQLRYDYADAPGMNIASDFSTYESFDGTSFNYASSRSRDGEIYQQIIGHADMGKEGGKAIFRSPEALKYDLSKGTLFPMAHTIELLRHAARGDKFYSAQIFDGSDQEGPIEINSFIGRESAMPASLADNPKVDRDMLAGKAWSVRMAVFPVKDEEEESDYEMTMNFHDNGVISDMLIEYDDFSVKQRLVALEKIPAESCGSAPDVPKKP